MNDAEDAHEDEKETFDEDDEPWPDSISRDFAKGRDATWLKTRSASFDETVTEYRAFEKAFLSRAGKNEAYARDFQRCVAEDVLKQAIHDKPQPFAVCQKLWNELLAFGPLEIDRQCTMTWFFADCCRQHGQTEMGLSVLDPLVAELERLRAEPDATQDAARYYDGEIDTLRKLRAKLVSG